LLLATETEVTATDFDSRTDITDLETDIGEAPGPGGVGEEERRERTAAGMIQLAFRKHATRRRKLRRKGVVPGGVPGEGIARGGLGSVLETETPAEIKHPAEGNERDASGGGEKPAAAPAAVAAVLLLRSAPGVASTPRTTQPHLLLLAASSPLLLLPLGFDWYRWVTLAVVNLVLAGLWHQAARPAGGTSGDAAGRDVRMDGPGPAVIGAVLIAIVLGGLSPLAGVTGLLDVVR
jgi:hypothetical protein